MVISSLHALINAAVQYAFHLHDQNPFHRSPNWNLLGFTFFYILHNVWNIPEMLCLVLVNVDIHTHTCTHTETLLCELSTTNQEGGYWESEREKQQQQSIDPNMSKREMPGNRQ